MNNLETFNINTDSLVKFTNRLERLNDKAMPNAVRNTLNSLAFDVKKRTLQTSAASNFEKRQPDFFKYFSHVERAKGNDIRLMQAEVGMRDPGGNNYAVKDLEQQEFGGVIKKKSFIPMKSARRAGKNVRKNDKMGTVNGVKIIHTNRIGKNKHGKNIVLSKKQQFVHAAFKAFELGTRYVLGGKTNGGGRTLFELSPLKSSRKTGKLIIKSRAIYNVRRGRTISVKATHYMQEAVNLTTPRADRFYKYNAKREFDRVLK